MTTDGEIVWWLHDAAKDAKSWESVRGALQARDRDGEDVRLRPFIFAFAFALHERSSGSRQSAGGPFGAMLAGEGWRFPPALADISDEDVAAWREAFDALDARVIRARLGDLLWERKAGPRPDLAARAACDALLEITVDEDWRVMDRVRCASRALELARETRDAERQARVVAGMVEFAEADLRSNDGGPGASLGMIRPLIDLPGRERPPGLDELLQRVQQRYGEDPYIVDSVAELRSRLVDRDQQAQLHRDQVRRWREEAEQGDILLRVHRLEHALELARTHGLNQDAEELRRELGRIRPEDLGLEQISAEVEVPAEDVKRFLGLFDDARSWSDALHLLAAQPAPGGPPEALEQRVDQLMSDFPVQYLFAKTLVGPDNATTLFRASEPDQHRRLEIAEERARAARFWSIFCADALDRIGARNDRPGHDELVECFMNDFIELEVAERLARGLELFWEGQPDESAHVVAPRLERVVRELARRLGIPIVREPRPDRNVGGVEMLGALLRDLEAAFDDKGWHAYLVNLLADPLGMNLRNGIAHGLHGTVGRLDASLLIQAALRLAGVSLVPVDHPPPPPAGSAPTNSRTLHQQPQRRGSA